MPQPFRDAVITNKGLQLLTKAQAGEVKIEFTRVVTGSGSYTENERNTSILQERELLKDQKNSYGLSNIEIYSECSVKLTALITNHDPVTEQVLVTEGYYINEMGIYAKPYGASQDTEVLYSITVTSGETGDYMPTYNGYNPTQIIQDYFVTVNNAPEVTLQTDNGAVALADDLVAFEQRTVNALNNKVDKDGDVSNTIVTFSQSDTRGNIKSGEKLSVIFGKIMKMFSDMKQAAFYSVINNLLTTQTGVGVLDAYQGKVLKDLYDALNRNVTELNKNIVFRSGTRNIKANTTGAWYRLGHARKVSSFYGEFLIWHQWTSNPSTMSKLIVGVNTSNKPSSMIKEVFCTCMDTTQSPQNKNSLIQKARAVYYPAGSWNYDIYIDVFIKSSGAWVQGDNQWWYTLSREMHTQSLNCEWVDDVFGSAGVSAPYITQEFSFV